MTRWVLYILGLAAFVAMNVAALGDFQDGWIVLVILVAVTAAVLVMERRLRESDSRVPTYRRTYEASRVATYSALYGAVIHFGYKVKARDPSAGTLQFKTGFPDLLIPRPELDFRASVREIDDKVSEVLLAGHADLGLQIGSGHRVQQAMGGLSIFPEGTGPAAKKLLDRVDATVITNRVVKTPPAEPIADTPQNQGA